MPAPAELANMLDIAASLQHNMVNMSCFSCSVLTPHVAYLLQLPAWPC